jgi:hypothetical protein
MDNASNQDKMMEELEIDLRARRIPFNAKKRRMR